MTVQEFLGSDHYGDVKCSYSYDDGLTWTNPELIEGLATIKLPHGLMEGNADVRPEYHPQTKTVIALGCNTYYNSQGTLHSLKEWETKMPPQFPVYAIRYSDGRWSGRKRLEHTFFADCSNWRTACAQMVVLPNGNILVPIYFQQSAEQVNFSVCSALCSFDGQRIRILNISNILSSQKTGLCEPSLAYFRERYYMTVRADDGHGYFSVSSDGLSWGAKNAWHWDDGTVLTMSETQQHWLASENRLYLVYTRKAENNKDVFRWRSPLFIAEFDPNKGCLLKKTEKTVFPLLRSSGLANLLGNFHVTHITPACAWVSDAPLWIELSNLKNFRTEVWLRKIESVH